MSAPWVLVTGDIAPHGGQDRANYELARHLLGRGTEVHLVAHRVDPSLAEHRAARVHRVPRPAGSHQLGQPFLNWVGQRVAREVTGRDAGARVVVNGGNCAWPDVSWVHSVHARWPVRDEGAPAWARAKNRIAKRLAVRAEARVLGRARLLIANSDRTRQDLEAALGIPAERIRVVRLGIDPEAVKARTAGEQRLAQEALGVGGNDPVVLFAGALGFDRNKGFDVLLDAWALLCGDPGFKGLLLAAGAGHLPFWQRKIDRAGLSARVRLVGFTPSIPNLLAAADLAICPSRYEAFGLFALEALAAGVPALVSARAGVAELYPPSLSELLLDAPEDSQRLAERVRRWRQERGQRKEDVHRCAPHLRAHTWARMASEVVEAIERAGPST